MRAALKMTGVTTTGETPSASAKAGKKSMHKNIAFMRLRAMKKKQKKYADHTRSWQEDQGKNGTGVVCRCGVLRPI
jgi:hypothetical protein